MSDLNQVFREAYTDEARASLRGGLLDISRNAKPSSRLQIPKPATCSLCGQRFEPGVFHNFNSETGATWHRGGCPQLPTESTQP